MTKTSIDWRPFLSDQRIGSSRTKGVPTEQVRSEFHKDYDRIIFSSAFRRLSDKTQVVPFPQSDYTRQRLTHSLEVSCVGRSLATEIYSAPALGLREVLPQGDFEAIVATACLAHDIGNPPFGHFGERAIQDWARVCFQNGHTSQLTAAEQADLTMFEGNAQTFRVLTRLQMSDRIGGMRLTAATLGAVIKYPRPSLTGDAAADSVPRKHGCFQDDLPLFREVFEAAGRLNTNDVCARHPLAWLSEAADDICYVIVDLEDGCNAGLIPLNEACEILDAIGQPQRRSEGRAPEDRLSMGRALAINQLVQQCAAVYQQHIGGIMDGSFHGSLIDECPTREPYRLARQIVRDKVFHSKRVLELEAGGYRAIQGLLQMLVPAVLSSKPDRFEQHVLRLMGPQISAEMSDYRKLLACTDLVSGMTDRFCIEQFRKFSGLGDF